MLPFFIVIAAVHSTSHDFFYSLDSKTRLSQPGSFFLDGPQPDELSEQLVQKMNEMLEDYRKEEVVQHNGLYRRGARHVGPARRGGFQCDIRVLSELCLNK